MSVTVRRKRDLKIGQAISFGAIELVADVAVAEGGDGAGPNPHDLYDAALGACKALTVMWYAARKQIPVEDISVRVDRDASHERAGNYALTTVIAIGGTLSDAQIEELRAVAEKCPIHKLMTAVTTTIRTDVQKMS